jgi:hypothetical protein
MKNNIIYNTVCENKQNYCHNLEVGNKYDIENCIDQIWCEFKEIAPIEDLKEFFNTLIIGYYEEDENGKQIENEENENEVFLFCTNDWIDENIF